jgi:hypothetical protein
MSLAPITDRITLILTIAIAQLTACGQFLTRLIAHCSGR